MLYVRMLFTVLFGAVVWTIVTALDLITLTLVYITKGVRWLWIALYGLIWDEETSDSVDTYTDLAVNYAYKYIVDKLYPTDEEEEP